jgi:ABC-type branched-subunit amino acid transport system substrate-binding protein
MTTRLLQAALAALVLCGAAGCPRSTFDPSARPKPPQSANPQAQARFDSARALFERDATADARAEFEKIAKEYPDDPVAPQAALYAGMAAFRSGDPNGAVATLEPLVQSEDAAEDVRVRARFFLGLAYAAAGKPGAARGLLEPFVGKLADDDPDLVDLNASLASAYDGVGEPGRALEYYDKFFARARPAERAHIGARVSVLVDGLDDTAASAAYGRLSKGGPSAAFLGRRLALGLCAAGQAGRAQGVLDETAEARALVGLERDAVACVHGGAGVGGAKDGSNADLVGVVVPLSGKRRLVGEATLRGVTLAAGTFVPTVASTGGVPAAPGGPRPFVVGVRDTGDSPESAGKGVDELVGEGAIAIVGPADRDAARAAAARAEAAGVTFLSLDVGDGPLVQGAPHVFRVVVPVELRARALARAAYAAGARDFALLAPDMAYGTRATKAFKEEVTRLGGKVTVDVTYAKDATSFVDTVKKVAGQPFDALFVPDTAARLELIAPQLAVANLVVAPPGAKKPKRGRTIVLLSTAEALAPGFLRGSGRYTVGALLAPGFYPDDVSERIGPYVQRFRAAYGVDPTYLDAYAYDAALCVRAAVEAGATSRAAVAQALGKQSVSGLTGQVRFDDARGRADEGVLFQVVKDGDAQRVKVFNLAATPAAAGASTPK